MTHHNFPLLTEHYKMVERRDDGRLLWEPHPTEVFLEWAQGLTDKYTIWEMPVVTTTGGWVQVGHKPHIMFESEEDALLYKMTFL